MPFDIPDSWTWIRFPNLVNFTLGKTPERHNPKYWSDGKYPWFSIADMKDKKIVTETKEKISEYSLSEYFNSCTSPAGTLIMSFKLTVGKVSILGVDAIHNEAIISIFPYLEENNTIRDWLFYTLGLIVEYVDQTDAIKGSTLNKEKMNSMLIPLPPIKEQNRIISKLLESEPLIVKYGDIENKLSLLESEFPEKLKKSILQYAIEGKLVKQDPNDEPASVLLERIKAEKERLIKEGKVKRDKNESYIYQGDDKNYYENLPFNWKEVSLKMICSVKGGKRIPAGEKFSVEPTNHKYLRVTDMKNSTIVGCAYISDDIYSKIKSYTISADDIYITVAGTIGSVGIIPNEFNEANLTENADKLLLNPLICKEWFINLLQSEVIQKQIRDSVTKVGQPKLAIKRIEELRIPLPPVNEQIRINQAIKILLLSL